MKQYKIVTEKPKVGDYAINTHDKNAEPRKVRKNMNGTLGISLDGWFDWMPLSDRHKKIKFITTKSPPMKKKPKITYTQIVKVIQKAKTKGQLNKVLNMYFNFAGNPRQNTEILRRYNEKNYKIRFKKKH